MSALLLLGCGCRRGGGPGDGGASLPPLGVYAVNVDGSGFRLLVDTGARQLTHVRRQPGTDWLTATRYTEDPDGNGLAMELEKGFGAYYLGAEIVVLPLADPTSVTVVAGGTPGKLCANSSWTADGKLIFIHQDHPSNPDWTRLKRASFSSVPAVSSIAAVPTPAELLLPVDPHQNGPSIGGSVVFAALRQGPAGWMRPVWRMASEGTTNLGAVSLVGCPACPVAGGCCGWAAFTDVLGTNDPRMSHSGEDVIWMQQHPDVSFAGGTLFPYRQQKKPAGSPQIDLPVPDGSPIASQAFVEWREDDLEVVYWAVELENDTVRQNLYRMKPDGTDRQRIPLPAELCAQHPSYMSTTEIVFTGWRCVGAGCSCDIAQQ